MDITFQIKIRFPMIKVENSGSHKIWSTSEYQIPIEFVLKIKGKQALIAEGGNNFT